VRVLLGSAKTAKIESTAAWTVTDAAGSKLALDPGALLLKAKLALADHPELQPPFTFVSKEPLLVGNVPYRGKLNVSSDGKLVQVIDTLGLESYLKGVVPAEMPSAWPTEALKAQAVAARSYALANVTTGRAFDLYGDTRSQVFGGVKVENAATSAAVDATKGQVVLYGGKVADTLFFSTSGGRTASYAEATGTAVPYLVSVPDPYDTLSPFHDWGPVLLDAATVAKQLKVASPISALRAVTGPSGRVQSVTLTAAADASATFTGAQVRAALGLRSTWFTPVLLALQPQAKTMTYGGAVSLTGFARGAAALSLEAKTAVGDWSAAGDLTLGADGSFSTIVRPQATTSYRLAWAGARTGLARISVAPRVDASISPAAASGTIHPAVAGAVVQLQRQAGTSWTTVSAGTTDAAGAWRFPGPLQAGAYRVRSAPGHGLVPGVSASTTLP
jgi:SpoIID/LytB domain protein